MALVVKDACRWAPSYVPAFELYIKASEKEIGVNSDFLQRKIQTDEWTKNNNQRIKDYLRSLVKGNGKVDFFMIAPLDLVIESLENKLKDTSKDENEIEGIKSVLKVVLKDKENGVSNYVVDGQNRLFKAFIPFFESKIPFGKEALTIIDTDAKGEDAIHHLENKLFKDLAPKIQKFLQTEIDVPLAEAKAGDIDSFTDALIAKNTNIAWSEWQRMRIKNTFTNYNLLVNSVMEDKDKGLIADKLYSKLGNGYEYDTDGWEKFISEMLIWMNTRPNVQPNKSSNDGHLGYFEGSAECKISKNSPNDLKKYLREFAKCGFKKKNQHMMVRNYVMFRYAIDNPTRFPTINIPSWKIIKGSEFAAQFTHACEALHKVKGAKEPYKLPDGKIKWRKTPNYFPWATSEYSKEFIECRLRLLSNYFTEKLTEELIENNTVSVKDTTTMPTVSEMYSEKRHDHKGNYVSGLDLNRKSFHRGHKKPKGDGGENTIDNLDFQNVESNLSYGKTEVTS